MNKDIKLTDLSRILFGNTPPEFLLEVFIRTIFIFVALIIVMRWLGKRMNGKLTITEMAVVLTLGAIVSVPMQTPDRGLLQGFIVLTCALLFQRGISLWGFKHKKIELLTQGTMNMLVKDGVIQLQAMKEARISNQQLFATLRSKKVHQLGQLKRVYLEASGMFSIYEEKNKKPGLSTLPETDRDILDTQTFSKDTCACSHCGYTQMPDENRSCPTCGNEQWKPAIL
jgi:uncharacterized membrane protein YcaP (DUF421 family)